MNYRKVNNLVGWITGAIAYFVFLKTMEPTASFWDCGEFLSCAYKLEVGHSPGAPFFMMVQRVFGLLAGGNLQNVASFINSESALTSGLTILFLFWTITHFAKKLLAPGNAEPDSRQTLLIMGAGLVGGLAYTFSDTFWFSAVEAEVYGTSSFFTAITFWAILKWENVADTKYADRWLVLISYLIGISVCVHLLNLLTIPAVAMVYYFRRYQPTAIGTVIAFFVGCVLLGFVQFGIIQYIPILASKFDILFTNSFGLPFDTGSVTFLVLCIGALVWLLMFAKRRGQYLLHTGILCILFIIIGYSSYIVPIIRSRADVPIDMTNPDNALSLESYVSREQFGSQPLFYGQDFNSPVINYKTTGSIYNQAKKDGKDFYEVVGSKGEPEFDPATLRFFPRMYSSEAQHVNFYRSYLGLGKDEAPTSADNWKYFFNYQMNWMWWRYVMWNYVGRQNDFEGQGEPKNGNWLSGIKFIDQMHGTGDTDKMGDGYANNGARNELYFLPLILGLLGLVYQFNQKKRDGVVTFVLFFFTGAAIGIYLNMPPLQPRERDYAFAGCTYAFAIWIGLGVLMINSWIERSVKNSAAAIGIIAACLLLVPVLMASKEWDDHDRSKKTLARSTAFNTLQSCAPNAVLFTYGDNDTYPIWYLQEVEGIRKDVRVINTSLLGIDWYIDQLNYRINDADAVPMIWKKADYVGDRHNYIRYFKNPNIPQDKYFNLNEVCNFIISSDPNNKQPTNGGESENYLPSKNFVVPSLTKAQLVAAGLVKASDTATVNTEMKFTFPKDLAYKSDLAIMNIVAGVSKEGWKRPLYFDAGLPAGNYAGMADYMQLEGLVYRLMPYRTTDSSKMVQSELGTTNVDKSYDLFMNTYIWGGADRKDVYFDEKNRLMFAPYRTNSSSIAAGLVARGRKDDAVKLLDKVMTGITEHSYLYDVSAYYVANAYYHAGAKQKGHDLAAKVAKNAEDAMNWAGTLSDDGKQAMAVQGDLIQNLRIMNATATIAAQGGDTALAKSLEQRVQAQYTHFKSYIDASAQGQ
ncbi:MAG: DUF2723 domain-containing protein [Flavipsychrobacter sp.]|nr:DUF2723 domain-containing protein [Flavipsychrobacter sp.]